MRKAAKQILLCAAALLLVCIVCRIAFFDHLNIYLPIRDDGQAEKITILQPDVLRAGEAEPCNGYLQLRLYGLGGLYEYRQ